MVRVSCLLSALCWLCSTATARQEQVGGVAIDLPPPPGYCELSEAQPADDRILSLVRIVLSGTRLLAMSAECRQLDDLRMGRRTQLANTAQYQTAKVWENARLPKSPAELIKETCRDLRGQGESFAARTSARVQRRLDELSITIKLNETRFLGVLGEDDDACYASLLQRLRSETGEEVTVVVVFTSTIIKSKRIYYYLTAPYAGAEGIAGQLEEARRSVAALAAANRN